MTTSIPPEISPTTSGLETVGVVVSYSTVSLGRRVDVGPLPTVFNPPSHCNFCSLPPREYTTTTNRNGDAQVVPLPYSFDGYLDTLGGGDASTTRQTCDAFVPACGGSGSSSNTCRPPMTTTIPPSAGDDDIVQVYSPGLHCPSGWNTVRSVTYADPEVLATTNWMNPYQGLVRPDETAFFCCPGYDSDPYVPVLTATKQNSTLQIMH